MYCKGRTGNMVSLGKGAVSSYLRDHKLNTNISTEPQLVGVDDVLPQVSWSLYFIKSQGYTVSQKMLYQDNMDTMRLEVNGVSSRSKITKHIKAKLLFIRYKIEDGDI